MLRHLVVGASLTFVLVLLVYLIAGITTGSEAQPRDQLSGPEAAKEEKRLDGVILSMRQHHDTLVDAALAWTAELREQASGGVASAENLRMLESCQRTSFDLSRAFAYAPTKISAVELLRHTFLNPNDAPLSVDSRLAIQRVVEVYRGVIAPIVDNLATSETTLVIESIKAGRLKAVEQPPPINDKLLKKISAQLGRRHPTAITAEEMEAKLRAANLRAGAPNHVMYRGDYYDATGLVAEFPDIRMMYEEARALCLEFLAQVCYAFVHEGAVDGASVDGLIRRTQSLPLW